MYGLGGVLNRLAGLLLIPILLRALSPEEWGVYTLLLLAGQVAAVVPGALADGMSRLYFDPRVERDRDAVVSTALILGLGVAALVLAGLPAAGRIAAGLLGDASLGPVAGLAMAAWSCEALFELEQASLRLRIQSGRVVRTSLARSLAQFGLCVLFVVPLGMGVAGLLLGYLLAVALVALPLLASLLREHGTRFRPELARWLVGPSLPLLPAGLARSLLGLAPAYALNLLGSTGAVGIYGLATKLADQLRVALMGPFADIWGVRRLEVAGQPERALELYRVLLLFVLLLLASVLALALYAPELVRLLAAPEFRPAESVVPIVGFAYALVPLHYALWVGILRSGRTTLLLRAGLLALALAIGLLVLLVPRLGVTGAALAELGAGLALIGLLAIGARRAGAPAGFPWSGVATLFALAVATWASACGVLGLEVGVAAFAGKAVALAAFAGAAFALPVLTPRERREIRGRLLGWLGRPARRS